MSIDEQGFIHILVHGRQNRKMRIKFIDKWYDGKEHAIRKSERASCCYAYFYDPHTYTHMDIIDHVCSEEHIKKRVAEKGVNDPLLVKEVGYYGYKIIKGDVNERRNPNDLPF